MPDTPTEKPSSETPTQTPAQPSGQPSEPSRRPVRPIPADAEPFKKSWDSSKDKEKP
jgi:hypothetical protein